MIAFPKPLSRYHGSQGGSNLAMGVNKRGPRPFQCTRFGSQQRLPLSPIRPVQGGVQNSASPTCWAKNDKRQEDEEGQKAEGSGENDTRDEDPSLRYESTTEKTEVAESYRERKPVTEEEELELLGSFDAAEQSFVDFDPKAHANIRTKLIKGLFDSMPPACDLAWKESQQAWLDDAINHPITLNNSACTVHLFGIAHGNPTNASALRALFEAIQPDTIAIEDSPESIERLRAEAQELAPQLDKLMALECPAGIREAHMALSTEDKSRWSEVCHKENIAADTIWSEEHEALMVHGTVGGLELLAAAHLSSSGENGTSLEAIDLEETTKVKQITGDPSFKEEYQSQCRILLTELLWSDALNAPVKDLTGGLIRLPIGLKSQFVGWYNKYTDMKAFPRPIHPRDADGSPFSPPQYQKFLDLLGKISISPAAREIEMGFMDTIDSRMTGKAAAFALNLRPVRELHMLARLKQLAEGQCSAGGPRKCIVAVVGRGHVAHMRQMAASSGMWSTQSYQ